MTTPYERPPVPPVGSYYNNVPPGAAPPPPMPLHAFPPYVPPKKSNAGKIIAGLSLVAVALVAVIASSQNSTGSASAASPSVTADTPYTPPSDSNSYTPSTPTYGSSIDDTFVNYLQTHDSVFTGVDGSTMIRTAHSLCTMLEAGGTIVQAGAIAMRVGYTPTQAGTFVGAAVAAYCPQYAGN